MIHGQLVSRGIKDARALQVIGGLVVMPLGDEESQVLQRVRRTTSGFDDENLGECRFAKLLGRYGWPD